MRRLQLIAHGEPADVIELNTVSEPTLGQEEVLVSMEAAPLNPSDFMLVRGHLWRPTGLPILGRCGGRWPSHPRKRAGSISEAKRLDHGAPPLFRSLKLVGA
jgi:hypothetical protein